MRALLMFVLMVACAVFAPAATLDFNATSGSLAAEVTFVQVGSTMTVTLANTSTYDVLVPTQVLTGVFFDMPGIVALLPEEAVLSDGSTVLFGTSDPGGEVGGEWAYACSLSGAPATCGISSTGLGLFGGATFPGSNLQGPSAVDGLQYGLTAAGDNPATGNTPVTGSNALIQNSVTFVFAVPQGFQLTAGSVTNVSFQYGTALCDPRIPASQVPEPGSLALIAGGLGLIGLIRRRS